MNSLFVTGAAGFVGRTLLRQLSAAGVEHVTCVVRQSRALARQIPPSATWRYLDADLRDSASYIASLPANATIIHLAAATGAATRRDHFEINVEATRKLLHAAAERGARRFIYVSSIAAKFADQRHYAYAQSKLQAEALVKASGLDYAIVRPTIVLGPGSAVLKGLRKLAVTPWPVVFGDGSVRVQPVHVNDLARLLIQLTSMETLPPGRTIEAGGPEIITMSDFIVRIRAATRAQPRSVIRIPTEPLRTMLALSEPVFGRFMPITAGQLCSFVNDGVAERNAALESLAVGSSSLETMLEEQGGNAQRS